MQWSMVRLNKRMRGGTDQLSRRPHATEEMSTELGRGDNQDPLVPALDNLEQGIATFDGRQNLIFCNRACAEIYRLPPRLTRPGTALSKIVEYRVAQGILKGEDPQAHVREVLARVASGEASTTEYELSDGRVVHVSHRPMPGGGWISLHQDITARKREEREHHQRTQAQHTQLEAAIANMSQGLAMFDADHRLIVCNRLYADMFGLPPELVQPGTLLTDIIAHRTSHGAFFGRHAQAHMRLVMGTVQGRRPVSNDQVMTDGRIIRATHQPLPSGGWIATFENVTEQRRAEQELQRTKVFVDNVIENVPVAILVREPKEMRYVLINRAAERFIGIQRERVIGKTPSDIFPRERAELIAQHDAEAMQSPNVPMIIEDHVIQLAGGGERIVITKKLTVRGDDDETVCLIAVIEDVTEKRQAQEKIAFLAHHDPLTELPNRAHFSERLEEALNWVERNTQLAVLFLDLDHFKNVNDTLGHFIGDELLKTVAGRLRGCIREVDLIGRLGGDEFAIVQTAINSPEDASRLAHRIQEVLRAPYDLGGFQATVDVSIGIAMAPDDATDSVELMKRADMALYQAKAEGRSTYCFFEPALDAAMKARRKLDTDLRQALARNEFEMHYQPVVDLLTSEIVGLEGLLRWRRPDGGMVSPADFIPVAEDTGLIVPIGDWVIRQACADAVDWPEHVRIAINLSPVQFRSANLVPTIVSALGSSGIAPSRLELEITEDVLLKHNQENLAVLERLRQLGVRIVMDDFGTGYCSLNYLRLFPFDKVKIDRAFIKDLSADNDEAGAIIEAVVGIARALRVPTTAEGVETPEQLRLARAAGCNEYQGYLFSRARPKDEILRRFFSRSAKATSAA